MNKPGTEVINAFIAFAENIANVKTNILDFGSDDMVFCRGGGLAYGRTTGKRQRARFPTGAVCF